MNYTYITITITTIIIEKERKTVCVCVSVCASACVCLFALDCQFMVQRGLGIANAFFTEASIKRSSRCTSKGPCFQSNTKACVCSGRDQMPGSGSNENNGASYASLVARFD